MNVINAGSRYQIYGEDVKTYQKLPVGTYIVNFHPMQGFSLSIRNDLTVTEEKIYGNSLYKVNKVMKSYNSVNRNFGVLLSGQKGIGKSLFVRLLAEESIKANLPVVTVTMAAPGLATFISSIDQDCVVIFDEFEKTFTMTGEENQQEHGEHIRQHQEQVRVVAGQSHSNAELIAAGFRQTKHQTDQSRRADVPVAEDHGSDGQISVTEINTRREIR